MALTISGRSRMRSRFPKGKRAEISSEEFPKRSATGNSTEYPLVVQGARFKVYLNPSPSEPTRDHVSKTTIPPNVVGGGGL